MKTDRYRLKGTLGALSVAAIAAFATTASFAQQAPSDLEVISATDTSVTLDWTPSSGSVDYYRIRVLDAPGGTFTRKVSGQPPYEVTNPDRLGSGMDLRFQIKTTFTNGDQTSYSSAISGSTTGGGGGGGGYVAPTVPENVRATNITADSITIAWNASTASEGIAEYKVRWSGGSNPMVAGTSRTFPGLNADTNYTFEVRAHDEAGDRSSYSDLISVRTSAAGGGGGGGGSLEIGFDSPVNNASYDAADFGAGGGPWVSVETNAVVTKVDFYINDFLVDTDTRDRNQYDYQYNYLQGGTYELKAVATGLDGSQATDIVNISVNRDDKSNQYNFKRLNGNRAIVDIQTFIDAGATRGVRHNTNDPGEEYEHTNINGPSVINVNGLFDSSRILTIPSGPGAGQKANYYMYFAHHHGQYIRMAYARNIEGPWHLYNVGPEVSRQNLGVLAFNNGGSNAKNDQKVNLANGLKLYDHMASPEALVVDGQLYLYFHGLVSYNGTKVPPQKMLLAVQEGAQDGLSFKNTIIPVIQSNYYATYWEYDGEFFGTQHQGRVLKHPNPNNFLAPVGSFNYGNNYWDKSSDEPFEAGVGGNGIRHVKAEMEPGTDTLFATFSVTGDVPEQLYYRTVDMAANASRNINQWQAGPVKSLAVAEAGWEGGQFPVVASSSGVVPSNEFGVIGVNQLRDPDVFIDNDGKKYVFYTGSGESAIGVAELVWVE